VITETDEVAAALDDAAARWPEDAGNRTRLLAHLVAEGHRAVAAEQGRRAAHRQDAVGMTSGVLSGVYGPDYLSELRSDWPA